MTHTPHRPRPRQTTRSSTKDSWLTIDWGERAEPSHLHGVLDQIAGVLIRDSKLVQQGRNEWLKASAISKARKKRQAQRANGGYRASAGKTRGASTPSSARKGTSTPPKKTGFLSGLFGKAKPAPVRPSGGTLRRAMSTPGRQHSSTAQVRRRATDGARMTRPDPVRRPTARK